MKLERMLSIITYLLNHEKVKAQELADKYEVSVRTIYRDLDAISQAGVPIAAYQGTNGGIGIIEGYKLDKSVLTGDELLKIVTGLKGLNSISDDIKTKLLIDKLMGIASKSEYLPAGSEIMIDLSSWNKNDLLGERIREIKRAIQDNRIILFTYYSNEMLTVRKVEPYIIVFKESNWYLYAYCLLRQEFRLFKLRRINGLQNTEEIFTKRSYSLEKLHWDFGQEKPEQASIVVLFDKSMKYAVNDIFGINNYTVLSDGRLKVVFQMDMNWWLYGFLLGFGDKVEVLEPPELRHILKNMAHSICRIYSDGEFGK